MFVTTDCVFTKEPSQESFTHLSPLFTLTVKHTYSSPSQTPSLTEKRAMTRLLFTTLLFVADNSRQVSDVMVVSSSSTSRMLLRKAGSKSNALLELRRPLLKTWSASDCWNSTMMNGTHPSHSC
jgi:hypothetical protein